MSNGPTIAPAMAEKLNMAWATNTNTQFRTADHLWFPGQLTWSPLPRKNLAGNQITERSRDQGKADQDLRPNQSADAARARSNRCPDDSDKCQNNEQPFADLESIGGRRNDGSKDSLWGHHGGGNPSDGGRIANMKVLADLGQLQQMPG